MAKHDEIAMHIRERVESTFQQILEVIAKRKESTPEIDAKIEKIWQDFQAELKDLFKNNKLTTAKLRAPYLQQIEACFSQLKEDYQSDSKKVYPIKIPSLIYDEISERVDVIFQQMLQVITEHQGNTLEIDIQIEKIWEDFKKWLKHSLQEKKIATVALRAPYIQWGEDCFIKRKEAYEIASEAYLIKIPSTVYHQINQQVAFTFQQIEQVIVGHQDSQPTRLPKFGRISPNNWRRS